MSTAFERNCYSSPVFSCVIFSLPEADSEALQEVQSSLSAALMKSFTQPIPEHAQAREVVKTHLWELHFADYGR